MNYKITEYDFLSKKNINDCKEYYKIFENLVDPNISRILYDFKIINFNTILNLNQFRKYLSILNEKNIQFLTKLKDENFLIFYFHQTIQKFSESVILNEHLNYLFPEIKIIYEIFNEKLKSHKLKLERILFFDSICYFLLIKMQRILEDPNLFEDHLINPDPKMILEIRMLYILEYLKILDIDYVYLLGYSILSLKIYYIFIDNSRDVLDDCQKLFKELFYKKAQELSDFIRILNLDKSKELNPSVIKNI